MLFVFSILLGCSKPKTENQTSDNTATQQNQEEIQTSNQTNVPNDSNENSIEVSEDKTKSVDLPKKYPTDKFPIYKDNFILTVIELEGGYTITAYAKDDVKKVMEFYKTVLRGATVANETITDESLTSFGRKDGYVYQLNVGKSNEFEGYKTSIAIVLQPEK